MPQTRRGVHWTPALMILFAYYITFDVMKIVYSILHALRAIVCIAHERGTAARRTLGHNMLLIFTNYLHELGTAARRATRTGDGDTPSAARRGSPVNLFFDFVKGYTVFFGNVFGIAYTLRRSDENLERTLSVFDTCYQTFNLTVALYGRVHLVKIASQIVHMGIKNRPCAEIAH